MEDNKRRERGERVVTLENNEFSMMEMKPLENKPVVQDPKQKREFCYIGMLINGLKDSLEYLSNVQLELENLDDDQAKIKLLEDKKGRLDGTISNMKEQESVFSKLILRDVVKNNKELNSYFELCLQSIQKGNEWRVKIENDFVEALMIRSGSSSVPPENMIQAWETEAKRLVLRALNSQEQSQKKNICDRFIELDNIIIGSIKFTSEAKLNPDQQKLLLRIKNLQQFIKDNFSQLTEKE